MAILIECLTDNRNRTLPEIRHLVARYGGSLGEAGCVGWMFDKKGYVVVERSKADEEALMTMVLEAGGEDLRIDGDRYEIICDLAAFESVKRALEQHSIPTLLAELSMIPKNSIKLEGKEAEQMVHLMDALEDHDDVQKVWANFDIADEAMAQMAAG